MYVRGGPNKVITWTSNGSQSMVFCGIRVSTISREVFMNLIRDMRSDKTLKITTISPWANKESTNS